MDDHLERDCDERTDAALRRADLDASIADDARPTGAEYERLVAEADEERRAEEWREYQRFLYWVHEARQERPRRWRT